MHKLVTKTKLLPWALSVWLTKRLIPKAAGFGRFTAERWVAQSRTGRRAKARSERQSSPVHIVFWVDDPGVEMTQLHTTISSIQAQTSPGWSLQIPAPAQSGLGNLLGSPSHPVSCFQDASEIFARTDLLMTDPSQNAAVFDCFLRAGDRIEPDFIEQVGLCLAEHPRAQVIYFDACCDSAGGNSPVSLWLKPDWSPELLLSVNFLARGVVRRSFLESTAAAWREKVGRGVPQPPGWEQVWDWVGFSAGLRFRSPGGYWDNAREQAVVHLPEVLVRTQRRPEGETAARFQQIRSHLESRGAQRVELLPAPAGQTRLRWQAQAQLVSIIIPNRNHYEDLSRCAASIYRLTTGLEFEIIVVDNQSTDPRTLAYYAELTAAGKARIVQGGERFNFSKFCNLGAGAARGDVLVFLNNDTEVVDPDWLQELAQFAGLPEVGVVGGCLLYPRSPSGPAGIQHAGIVVGLQGHAGHVFQGQSLEVNGVFGPPTWYRNYLAVTGACLCVRKEVFAQVGGFDEAYQLAFSDVALGLRVSRAGYRNVYNPFARLLHYEGRSRGRFIPPADIERASQELKAVIARGDPYYNPGLSRLVSTPTLYYPELERETPLERLGHIEEWYR